MSWRLGILETGVIPSLQLNLYVPDAPPNALIDVPCSRRQRPRHFRS
jgi:hypothetical protein